LGKVVFIGLDGATFDIMWPMMNGGRLKNIREMMSKGIYGKLESTILPLSATAWNSFATGKNPGKHGIYDFSKKIEGTYQYRPTTGADRGARTLWDYLSKAGKKCCILNVPLTYPAEPINGIIVSGFPYPEERRDFAYPKEILDEIKDKLGITRLHKPSPHFLKPGDERKLISEMLEITDNQGKILDYLCKRESWDLFGTVFDATDVVSHFFWQYIDPKNPKYDAKKAKEFGPLFYDVYDSIDLAIGKMRANLSSDDNIFVLSDHGFGPVYYAVYMNNWLMEQKYLRLRKSLGTRCRKLLFKVGITTDFIFKSAKKLHIVGSKTYTYSRKSRSLELARKFSLSLDDIDWNETLVYSYGNYGQFFVNVKGREPNGKVKIGEDYNRLVSELVSKVRTLRDPKTDRILFDVIYTKDQIYSGPFFDSAPDIVFFDSTMTYRAHRLFEFGSKSMIALDPIYSGSHRMDGIFVGSGPAISHNENEVQSLRLIDLAPTIMHMLHVPIPQEMDGRVLSEIFKPGSDLRMLKEERYSEERALDLKIKQMTKSISMVRKI
jgi:predicted AlkP superfamily phosphohydrolase/phosphomutase